VTRARRLTLLAKLLAASRYASQDELVQALGRAGVEVTQATLSRDLRSLGVIRRPDAEGRPAYELPGPPSEAFDRERQMLDLKVFVSETRVAQNLVVVVTPPGHANGVARAIDLAGYPGFVGSVAGDDTILVVMQDGAAARAMKRQLDKLAGRGTGGAK
jgi:transcriptional regulator of arginine metabolism